MNFLCDSPLYSIKPFFILSIMPVSGNLSTIMGINNYIDTHAHFSLCMEDGGYSEEYLFSEMKNTGVMWAVQVSTEKNEFEWCVDFAEKHPNILVALGIHPSSKYNDDDLSHMDTFIRQIADLPVFEKIFGIGEIGLDYYWSKDNKEEQISLFERQLDIARNHDLPVIIHSRDAFPDTKSILKKSGLASGIIHCFSGDVEDARDFLDMGFHISFAGNLTYKKSVNLHDAVRYVPDDRLFLETDCPYLSAQQVRGKKNHPAWVTYTYQFAADKRGVAVDQLADTIYENFQTFRMKGNSSK